ncbi:hypothetical protein NAT47_08230 [Flavobacterium sp. HXWNR69]|uniref:Uncharacterized protein n=1 Tax=Flavobacterium fragile TaxID=2949085 RepID=A0ABT0THS9_9FLAO|nr:hypothetical protein [Flavobacterium sp. HXWNR69]MCL9770402.1 hypothetical protein [Flavobacterium sp. HXWNR69]
MKIITTFLLIFISTITLAQGGALADLKFEEAEIAFNNQNYETTIKKLDEFDKQYGSVSAKSLYLRIVSQDKLFVPNELYKNETQIDLLVSLLKNTSSYLKAMGGEELDDKFREVYNINEKLKDYPKNKAEWKKKKEEKDQLLAEEKIRAKKKKLERLAKIKDYDDKKDEYYREIAPKIDAWEYKEGIKIGMDFNDFESTHKDWFKKTYKTRYGYEKKFSKKHIPNSLESIGLKDNKIIFYEFEVINRDDESGHFKSILDNLKAYFGENLVFDRYSQDKYNNYYVIKSPYSKSKIIVLNVFRTIKILKMIGDFLEPQDYERDIDRINKYSEEAYDLDYLNRFTGLYGNVENGLFTFKRVENFPILEMSRGKDASEYWYFVRKKNKDEFVCSYKIVDKKKFDYDKDELIFNIEQNKLIIKFNGKEDVYFFIRDN